jgi:hypothetical protein
LTKAERLDVRRKFAEPFGSAKNTLLFSNEPAKFYRMGLGKSVSTILRETFSAPASGSYVIGTPERNVVIRQGGDYSNIDLSGCNLSGLDLHGTNFHGANLRNANLTGVNLTGADLTDADLSGAIVSGAKFDNASIQTASVDNLVFEIPPSGLSIETLRR